MNYLAHLHLADHSNTHALGNLLGDFVKGTDLSEYPSEIAEGIILHRHIDQYTDDHPANADARALFPSHYRRYSGICLDLFWDYFLSRQWQLYHSEDKSAWIEQQYLVLQEQFDSLQAEAPKLQYMLTRMVQYDWLSAYGDIDNIRMALDRIGQRLRKPRDLGITVEVLQQYEPELKDIFLAMYPDIMNFAADTAMRLGKH
ncbi:hypothetical protein BTA51_18010 [Hahella sp. CCB-MM4]|uniref:acyl carrier protein phosphodiesterase n=1 Tax=Hahella sp. (strain CCB-MM4) TaxID=1926491 RepID=UPI000B9BF9F4|nr:ACP phosphodiesterase [Hahella sp. CCB-MM4]OZG71902.1 hypothetical protein BTA51_18010 [Hahella sp. CCB-MM4]